MPKAGAKKRIFHIVGYKYHWSKLCLCRMNTKKRWGAWGPPRGLLGSGTPYKYIWGFKWVYINTIITINLIKIDLNTAKIIAVQD